MPEGAPDAAADGDAGVRPGHPARIERVGEAALLVVLGDELDATVNARVHRLAAALDGRRGAVPGLEATVPGYASLLVPFRPLEIREQDVRAVVDEALRASVGTAPNAAARTVTLPVRYGGAEGPDLAEVAERTGLTEDDVVRLHSGTHYTVFVVGFTPGFPYLGILPATLALPRRATPRPLVPAGSVAIAGRQTGIYPAATPGGWHVIGRTDAVPWDPRREPPALLSPGIRVRFVPA